MGPGWTVTDATCVRPSRTAVTEDSPRPGAIQARPASVRRPRRRHGLPSILMMALSWPSVSAFVRMGGSHWPRCQQALVRCNRKPISEPLGSVQRLVLPYSSSPVPQAARHRRVAPPFFRAAGGSVEMHAARQASLADDLVAAGFPRDLLDYVKNKDLGDEWYLDEDDEDEEEEGAGKKGGAKKKKKAAVTKGKQGEVAEEEDDEEEDDDEEWDFGDDESDERAMAEGPRVGSVHIRNSQRAIDVDVDLLERQIELIMRLLGRQDHDVSLWLTNDRTIREYNDRYRGKRKATDILSFGFHDYDKPEVPTPESMALNGAVKDLGDMIISVPYVKRQCERDRKDAEEQGESTWTGERGASGAMADIYDVQGRLPYLVIHGVLHLLGHDHETDEDYAVMVAREEDLIRDFRKHMAAAAEEEGSGKAAAAPAPAKLKPGKKAPAAAAAAKE